MGRRIDRVERQLLLELLGRVRRTTRAREDPGQLVREMARQRVQLDGPPHLRLGLLEASERTEIDAEQVVRLGVGRIERDRAVIQRLGSGPAPMVAGRRLGDERLREAVRRVDLQRAARRGFRQRKCLARRHDPVVRECDIRVTQPGVRGRIDRVQLDGLGKQTARSRNGLRTAPPQEVPALEIEQVRVSARGRTMQLPQVNRVDKAGSQLPHDLTHHPTLDRERARHR